MINIGLQVLCAKIRGFQAAGVSIHAAINKATGPRRHRLWQKKRELGNFNREHLIAYGLLRGTSYEKIERCSEKNLPNSNRVYELMVEHATPDSARQLTLEMVQALLTPTEKSVSK